MKVKPLNDHVFARKNDEPETTSVGGIIIPTSTMTPNVTATVIAVGPGKRGPKGIRIPVDTRPGDKIVIPRHAGTVVRMDSYEFVMVTPREILAVIAE